MRKLAVFVEGQTEALFFRRLLDLAAAGCSMHTQTLRQAGNASTPQIETVKIFHGDGEPSHFVSINDCGNDDQVISKIRHGYENLAASAHDLIIGVRDVYPQFKLDQVPQFRSRLAATIPQQPTRVVFTLGVMEFETWLLGEHTHFPKIHPAITRERIQSELGIDVINDDLQQRHQPSKDLQDAYWMEKIHYDKSRAIVRRILDALDFENLRQVSTRYPDLRTLMSEIDDFLRPRKRS